MKKTRALKYSECHAAPIQGKWLQLRLQLLLPPLLPSLSLNKVHQVTVSLSLTTNSGIRESLLRCEESDLLQDLRNLPRTLLCTFHGLDNWHNYPYPGQNVLRRVNELVKRSRKASLQINPLETSFVCILIETVFQVWVHALIISHLRQQLPVMFGKVYSTFAYFRYNVLLTEQYFTGKKAEAANGHNGCPIHFCTPTPSFSIQVYVIMPQLTVQ
jgi:hypothetical protein